MMRNESFIQVLKSSVESLENRVKILEGDLRWVLQTYQCIYPTEELL